MNATKIRSLGALATALLAACGGGSPSNSAPASALALCQAVVPAFTAKLDACGLSGMPYPYLELLVSLTIDCKTFGEAQAAGSVTFSPASSGGCLDAINGASCATLLSGDRLLPSACFDAVAPAVAAGGSCHSPLDIECVAGFCDMSAATACNLGGRCVTSATLGQPCSVAVHCAPGLTCNGATCEARPTTNVVGAGADCSALNTTCADGLFCDASTTPDQCAARKALGAVCSGTAPCQAGLRCDPGTLLCASRPALGQACQQGQAACAGRAYCGAGNICVAQPTLGSDCPSIPGEAAYCRDSWCAPPVGPAGPKCTAYTAPGAACDTGNLLQCGLSYACTPISGTVGVCARNYCGGA